MQLIDHLDESARERVLAGFAEARERPVTLRANTLKASIADICHELDAHGIAYEHVSWYRDALVLTDARERDVWDLDIYREGHIYLQSLSSMLPALLLGPRGGIDILDMCAAPGGKTSQIAALTNGSAHLTACEMSHPRAEKLSHNLHKLGAANVNVMRTDARRLDEFFRFDQILLDAPCTGTGTYRMGDERAARYMTEQGLAKVCKSQRALLDRGLGALKPGGTLVYSTCSILPEENDMQVLAALKRHRDCEIAPILLTRDIAQPGPTAALDGGALEEGMRKGDTSAPAKAMTAHDGPAPAVLPHALERRFACPVLAHPDTAAHTLTVAPTRFFEGFYVAVIRKKPRSS